MMIIMQLLIFLFLEEEPEMFSAGETASSVQGLLSLTETLNISRMKPNDAFRSQPAPLSPLQLVSSHVPLVGPDTKTVAICM